MKHKKAKPVSPPQALFESMEGVASSEDAASSVFDGSALQALAATDPALLAAEESEAAAVNEATLKVEDRAILAGAHEEDAEEAESATAQEAEQEEEAEQVSETSEQQAARSLDDAGTAQQPPASKNRTSMDNVALVFLEDAFARRLAVAWQVCGGEEDHWFDAAGLTSQQRQQARQVGRALRLNGICRDGGVTDPLALQYIQAVIAKPLTAAAKKKPKE